MIAIKDDNFDDLGQLRRKMGQLISDNGDLGEIIGALKSQRAALHIQLQLAVHSIEKVHNQLIDLNIEPTANLNSLIQSAKQALTEISICE